MGRKKKSNNEMIQFSLIKEIDVDKIYAEFLDVKTSADKVRRGVFAKQTDLAKKVDELTLQVSTLEEQIRIMKEWIDKCFIAVENSQKKEDRDKQQDQNAEFTLVNSHPALSAKKIQKLHISEIMDTDILMG